MHIRNDWEILFEDRSKNRVIAVCGSRAMAHTSGIPGITPCPRGDWCVKCIEFMMSDIADHAAPDSKHLPVEVKYLREVVLQEIARVAALLNLIDYKDIRVLFDVWYEPLWSTHSRSHSNIRFLVWSMMMDRCYDPSTPGWKPPELGGQLVDDRWHDFLAFSEAMPSGAVGVKPVAPGPIGPSNHAWITRG